MQEDIEWFPSKVDWWLAVILILLAFAPIAVTALAVIEGDTGGIVAGVLSGVVVGVILLGLAWPVCYGIGETRLVIRFGLVRQRVALDAIREVRPTHNLLSSPALSLDRLWIDHGGGWLHSTMISPDRREEFLALLARRARLRRTGERLHR